MKDEPKTVFMEKANCPKCMTALIIKKERTCIQPGVSAKYRDVVRIEKDEQRKLK